MPDPQDFTPYLRHTDAIDCTTPAVMEFARQAAGESKNAEETATKLFYAVRDGIRYNPYGVDPTRDRFTACRVLAKREGFCVEKALLLAAAARSLHIPSRLGFADIRNHLIPDKLREYMKTDIFAYHGYAELFLDGRWIKATPAFDIALCERQDIHPVEFNGKEDAVFQQYDRRGRLHIEYVCYHGTFDDLPQDKIIEGFRVHYPSFFDEEGRLTLQP